jgi:hypothetical protein
MIHSKVKSPLSSVERKSCEQLARFEQGLRHPLGKVAAGGFLPHFSLALPFGGSDVA